MNGSLLSEYGLQTAAAASGSQLEGQCVCVCVCVGGLFQQVLSCFSVSLRMVGPDQLMPGDPSQMESPESVLPVMVQAHLTHSQRASAFPHHPQQDDFLPPHVFCSVLRIMFLKCSTCCFLFCHLPHWILSRCLIFGLHISLECLAHGRCAERVWVCINGTEHWVPKKQALWLTLFLFWTLGETLHHFTASKALLSFFLESDTTEVT